MNDVVPNKHFWRSTHLIIIERKNRRWQHPMLSEERAPQCGTTMVQKWTYNNLHKMTSGMTIQQSSLMQHDDFYEQLESTSAYHTLRRWMHLFVVLIILLLQSKQPLTSMSTVPPSVICIRSKTKTVRAYSMQGMPVPIYQLNKLRNRKSTGFSSTELWTIEKSQGLNSERDATDLNTTVAIYATVQEAPNRTSPPLLCKFLWKS